MKEMHFLLVGFLTPINAAVTKNKTKGGGEATLCCQSYSVSDLLRILHLLRMLPGKSKLEKRRCELLS